MKDYMVNGVKMSIDAINAKAVNDVDWMMVLNAIDYLESEKEMGAVSVNLINGWEVALIKA